MISHCIKSETRIIYGFCHLLFSYVLQIPITKQCPQQTLGILSNCITMVASVYDRAEIHSHCGWIVV